MPKVLPYIIEHILLNKQSISSIDKPKIGRKYYYVLWWQNISLGHLYVEEPGNDKFEEDVFNAIISTLKSYDPSSNLTDRIKTTFSLGDLPAFVSLMNQLLAPYLPINIPDGVDISVVICTRNRSQSLKQCLDSLMRQVCKPHEIIVVDNAPTDDSTKLTAERYSAVRYCEEPRPGLDIARNTGARLAQFPIVAYTDDDVMVDPLWSYNIWQTFLPENVDAMTGLVIATSLETESQQIFEKNWGFNKGYRDIFFNADFIYKTTIPKVWEIGAGANMAFRKKAIEDVNYFDDRLDVGAAGCSGDSEIWYRMLAKNMTIHYNPRAIVYHEHRKELKQLHKQLFGYMRGHAASALIQHAQDPKVGYKRYVYFDLLKYYAFHIKNGFPRYPFRYQTLSSEIKGLLSGIRFYKKNKNKPSFTP